MTKDTKQRIDKMKQEIQQIEQQIAMLHEQLWMRRGVVQFFEQENASNS